MRNNERQFLVFDLEIDTRKKGARLPNFSSDFIPLLQKRMQSGIPYPIRAGRAAMILGDLKVDQINDCVILLIRLSDTEKPNVVYSDLKDGTFNMYNKKEGEGSDYCCHVLISLKEEKGRNNTYTCIIEHVSGVPYSKIGSFLSKILHDEYDSDDSFFTYPHPMGGRNSDGSFRTERCLPFIKLRGRPSDILIKDINSGFVSNISLIYKECHTPIGDASYFEERERNLKFKKVDNMPFSIWDSILNNLKKVCDTYQIAKIRGKSSKTGRGFTVDLDPESGAIINENSFQSFNIENINPPLAQSSVNIVDHLIDRMMNNFLDLRSI